jgi:hypothetical protein
MRTIIYQLIFGLVIVNNTSSTLSAKNDSFISLSLFSSFLSKIYFFLPYPSALIRLFFLSSSPAIASLTRWPGPRDVLVPCHAACGTPLRRSDSRELRRSPALSSSYPYLRVESHCRHLPSNSYLQSHHASLSNSPTNPIMFFLAAVRDWRRRRGRSRTHIDRDVIRDEVGDARTEEHTYSGPHANDTGWVPQKRCSLEMDKVKIKIGSFRHDGSEGG